MNEDELVSVVRDYAQNNSDDEDIHGFPHIERIYNTTIQMGKNIGAKIFVLSRAALLHDIGRKNEKDDPK